MHFKTIDIYTSNQKWRIILHLYKRNSWFLSLFICKKKCLNIDLCYQTTLCKFVILLNRFRVLMAICLRFADYFDAASTSARPFRGGGSGWGKAGVGVGGILPGGVIRAGITSVRVCATASHGCSLSLCRGAGANRTERRKKYQIHILLQLFPLEKTDIGFLQKKLWKSDLQGERISVARYNASNKDHHMGIAADRLRR